jgi:hypothetical protein
LSYHGNPNLKKLNQSIEWTPALFEEYMRCSRDPIYFVENYVKVIHIDDGVVPFVLRDYQREMLTNFNDERNSIIMTPRQAGKSVTVAAYLLWYVLFNAGKVVALLANKGDVAKEILSRIQLSYENLPPWLQQGVKECNKFSLVLENDSRILASATTKSNIRGFTVNIIFIDEAAHVENWDEYFTSVIPTISTGKETKIILVSTPNGLNHFHKLWVNAETGRNNYKPLRVHYSQVPHYTEAWKQKTLSDLNFDMQKFAQEYECDFIGSAATLIDGKKLKELVHQIPIASKDGLSQYALPVKGHKYAIICDVSHGKGFDYSAFQLIDVTAMPYQQVCVFRDNVTTPVDYAAIIHRTAKTYNEAIVLIEINGIGEQVAYTIQTDFGYENILFTENCGRMGKKITGGFGGTSGLEKGIRTTRLVKVVGCSILKLLIEQNKLIINDYDTIGEIHTFTKKNNSYEAASGKTDDLVMCLVLFAWLSDQSYFKEYTDINTFVNLRDRDDVELDNDLMTFGFVDDGQGAEAEDRGWSRVGEGYEPQWTPAPDLDYMIKY